MTKLVHLPTAELTPTVLVHQLVQDLPGIRSVAAVIQHEDGTMTATWSSMAASELCMAAVLLQRRAMDVVQIEQEGEG